MFAVLEVQVGAEKRTKSNQRMSADRQKRGVRFFFCAYL